jgi:hypothetical protein
LPSAAVTRLKVYLSLPAGQRVRPAFPVREDAEPPLLALGQRGQRLMHPGQVRGAAVGEGEHHAQQQGADGQLAPSSNTASGSPALSK